MSNMSKDIILVQKEFQVDNQKIKLFKTLPLKPDKMYDFLSKYLSIGKFKPTHPDFKHIFDYIDSIKMNNNSYLLSLLSVPQSPSDTNGLGNFFGNKMINVSNDLQIFPFGNVIRSNLSLISKRSANHPIFIIISIKGNKNLNDPYPSNQNNITIGSYIIDNWINTISKRYINYVNDIGFNMCVDIRFLKNIANNITNNTIHTINNDIIEKNNIENDITDNDILKNDTTENNIIEKDIEENNIIDKDVKENNIIEKDVEENNIKNDKLTDNSNIINTNIGLIENITKIQNMLNLINKDTKILESQDVSNNLNLSIMDTNVNYPIVINKTYYKYQEEILNLKKIIFYLINNNGKLYSNIYYEFTNDFLKSIFGNDFMSFVNK